MPSQRWKSRLLPGSLLIGFLAWMSVVCVSIANEPPEGSSSDTSLGTDVAEAVQAGDANRLQNLFHRDTVGDAYAQSLLDRLRDAEAANLSVRLESDGGAKLLVLGGHTAGRAICIPWKAKESDGRWYVDGTPVVRATSCSPK
jgi:hypothetical protein